MALQDAHLSAGNRALAVTLSFLTAISHASLLLDPFWNIQQKGTVHDWRRLETDIWNLVALAASVAGVLGAIKMSPALVSAYTAVHVVTLCFVSLTVLNIFLPIRIDSVVPLIPDWKLDPSRLCRDLDNAWDEDWVERCRTSFAIVETGLAAVAVVLMGAQWWALGRVWRWGAGLQTEEYRRRNEKEKLDVEADVSEKWERR